MIVLRQSEHSIMPAITSSSPTNVWAVIPIACCQVGIMGCRMESSLWNLNAVLATQGRVSPNSPRKGGNNRSLCLCRFIVQAQVEQERDGDKVPEPWPVFCTERIGVQILKTVIPANGSLEVGASLIKLPAPASITLRTSLANLRSCSH